jgi:predicted HicB family RNase H-like nuclease|tara:strand:- start:687 stop:836 length:150 start_codon:yes stop_codon:yes gene_type:complete
MKKLAPESFTLRMPTSLRSNLEDIATENEVSLSELVRYGLNKLVNDEQK